MKSIIPYTKEISFGSKIAEITSMSLEHEMDIRPGEVCGNFIISGDYKTHEVSVNREPFLYKLPFSMELTDQIDLDSLKFEITDFSYDVLNDSTVEVNIEFSIEAEEKEIEEEIIEEVKEPVRIEEEEPIVETEEVDELVELMEFDKTREEDKTLPTEPIMEQEELIEEVKEKMDRAVEVETKKETVETLKESEETIIKNVNPTDDSYATYHIHIVKDGENVETICTMYQSNMNLLTDYNDLSAIAPGDKIIIPKEDE